MKTLSALVVTFALIGLSLPTPASAATFTYVCSAAADPMPPGWTGGPWLAPVRLTVDTSSRTVELSDNNYVLLATTARSGHLSSLNDYRMDLSVTDSVIKWGVQEMWGFSGYVDRKTGQLDVIWVNPKGYGPSTLNRQFHGVCKSR